MLFQGFQLLNDLLWDNQTTIQVETTPCPLHQSTTFLWRSNPESLVKNNSLFTNLKKSQLTNFQFSIFNSNFCLVHPSKKQAQMIGQNEWDSTYMITMFSSQKYGMLILMQNSVCTFWEIAGVIILWSFNASKYVQ